MSEIDPIEIENKGSVACHKSVATLLTVSEAAISVTTAGVLGKSDQAISMQDIGDQVEFGYGFMKKILEKTFDKTCSYISKTNFIAQKILLHVINGVGINEDRSSISLIYEGVQRIKSELFDCFIPLLPENKLGAITLEEIITYLTQSKAKFIEYGCSDETGYSAMEAKHGILPGVIFKKTMYASAKEIIEVYANLPEKPLICPIYTQHCLYHNNNQKLFVHFLSDSFKKLENIYTVKINPDFMTRHTSYNLRQIQKILNDEDVKETIESLNCVRYYNAGLKDPVVKLEYDGKKNCPPLVQAIKLRLAQAKKDDAILVSHTKVRERLLDGVESTYDQTYSIITRNPVFEGVYLAINIAQIVPTIVTGAIPSDTTSTPARFIQRGGQLTSKAISGLAFCVAYISSVVVILGVAVFAGIAALAFAIPYLITKGIKLLYERMSGSSDHYSFLLTYLKSVVQLDIDTTITNSRLYFLEKYRTKQTPIVVKYDFEETYIKKLEVEIEHIMDLETVSAIEITVYTKLVYNTLSEIEKDIPGISYNFDNGFYLLTVDEHGFSQSINIKKEMDVFYKKTINMVSYYRQLTHPTLNYCAIRNGEQIHLEDLYKILCNNGAPKPSLQGGDLIELVEGYKWLYF